jgi:hypothetical protein
MFQFKIALHLETYWKTKHDTFGFRYLEQVLYLDSLLEKNGSFMQKHLFLFYWIQLPQWHTIQKHCFYFTQSKLPQWHHTKALFLFYPIKATTMTPYKSSIFILPNQSYHNDTIQKHCFYFTQSNYHMEKPRKWLSKYWYCVLHCLSDNRNISRHVIFLSWCWQQ